MTVHRLVGTRPTDRPAACLFAGCRRRCLSVCPGWVGRVLDQRERVLDRRKLKTTTAAAPRMADLGGVAAWLLPVRWYAGRAV